MKTRSPLVTLIGHGQVALALAAQFKKNKIAFEWLHGRHLLTLEKTKVRSAWVLLAVPDDQIVKVAQKIIPTQITATAVHFAGSLSAAMLRTAHWKHVLAAHPLMTFASAKKDFADTPWLIEGQPELARRFDTFLRTQKLGQSVRVKKKERDLYHAALVLGANGLAVLVSSMRRLLQKSGLPAATIPSLIAPLLRVTLENALKSDKRSGPWVRKDKKTIARHRQVLRKKSPPEVQSLYENLLKLSKKI